MVLHSVVFCEQLLKSFKRHLRDTRYSSQNAPWETWNELCRIFIHCIYVKVSFAQLAIKVLNCMFAKLDVWKLLLQIILVIQIYMYMHVRVVKNYWFSTNQIRLCWPLNLKEKLLSRETGDGLIHWTHWHSTL